MPPWYNQDYENTPQLQVVVVVDVAFEYSSVAISARPVPMDTDAIRDYKFVTGHIQQTNRYPYNNKY